MKRKLVLANGMEFVGKAFGSKKEVISEVVFNTSIFPVVILLILIEPFWTVTGISGA